MYVMLWICLVLLRKTTTFDMCKIVDFLRNMCYNKSVKKSPPRVLRPGEHEKEGEKMLEKDCINKCAKVFDFY